MQRVPKILFTLILFTAFDQSMTCNDLIYSSTPILQQNIPTEEELARKSELQNHLKDKKNQQYNFQHILTLDTTLML